MKSQLSNQQPEFAENDQQVFVGVDGVAIPHFYPRLAALLFILFIFLISCLFLPWIQTSEGKGNITALHPQDRLQPIIAPVNGRIAKWYVRDGSQVKAGDKIVEIQDIDPYNIQRLQAEIDAMQERFLAAKSATELAAKNYNRQQKLLAQGLTSRREMEAAAINYQKNRGDQEYYNALLIKSQAALARQKNQLILAERDGYIVNTLAGSDSRIVKAGDSLATFVPHTQDLAVELYVSGNDIPLIKPGQKVRLIFDGWPSVQFSGWPSVSIGTFPAVVKVVDYAASLNGLFRVLVIPDPQEINWPNRSFLRIGTQTQGYIQLNQVKLGYELWRQLNGFPVSINNKNNYTGLNVENKTNLGETKTTQDSKDEKDK